MKRLLLFMFFLPMLASAQTVSDVQNSGCLSMTRGNMVYTPTIILTKEGNILSVQLQNYMSNCGTRDFDVTTNVSGGNGYEPCSVTISVVPVIPADMDCNCPFNVSFTVRDLENNNFYLTCWWYDGQVELTDGEPLVLEYNTEDVYIDGLKYQLLKTTHQAKLLYQSEWDNNTEILQIPSEVENKGEKYTVTSISPGVFDTKCTIKKIILPKSVKNTDFGSLEDFPHSPFNSCLSLEAIEVEEGNPVLSSVDGVLFNKDKTTLIGYPAASPRESYTVPDGVKKASLYAFINSQYLKLIVLPDNMETLGSDMFYNSKNLEEVVLSSNINELPTSLFGNCIKLKSVVIPESVTIIDSYAFYECSSLDAISIPKSVTTVGRGAFMGCTSLKSATLSPNLKEIPTDMFRDCSKLTEVIIPFGITTIGNGAFIGCEAMQSFDLPESINYIDGFAFRYLSNIKDIYCHAKTVPDTNNNAFGDVDLSQITLHVPEASIENYQASSPWNEFGAIVPLETQIAYRPMIEDGKVWKVGGKDSGNPVKFVAYYYFDGDTIIGGKSCKQMMCQRYFSPDCPKSFYSDYWAQLPSLSKVGAWYEEDKKVYFCREGTQGMYMLYDFSLEANDTLILNDYQPDYIVGPKQTGGLKGFKGVYRDIMLCGHDYYITTWLEGVGGIDGPLRNVYPENESDPQFLMSCTVGDEVIYLNDDYEDGATPEGSRKDRFDFTHTIKTNPKAPFKQENSDACISSSEREVAQPKVKAPRRSDEAQSLYGEYNDLLLGIHLDPLDDAYLVSITNESGQVVYEKTINAGTIVGLSIDISDYAKGRYTVTVENSRESFTGEFEVLTTGISDAARLNNNEQITKNKLIYNLQGQRLSSLQKGLNIVNGKKVYVK